MNPYQISFARAVQSTPDAPALCVQGITYSYAELQRQVEGLRAALRGCALPAHAAVAIFAARSLTAYAGVLACAAEGFTWVPLNPAFPAERNLRMWQLSGATVVILGNEAQAQWQILAAQCAPGRVLVLPDTVDPALAAICAPACDEPAPLVAWSEDYPAYLLFTSGTTGTPKGIPVGASCLQAYLEHFTRLYPLPVGLRFSQMFDLTFDLSVHDLFVCWYHGGCLVVPTDLDLLMPLQFVRRHQIQVWFSVPSMASIAKQSGLLRPGVLPSLRYAFFCGEALPVGTAQAWMAAAPDAHVANLYGPTEATIAITAFTLQRNDPHWQSLSVVPIGFPYPHQFAKVVKDGGEEAAPGEIGELWLAGSQLTAGYLGDPAKTAAAFVQRHFADCAETRWYRTGDCAVWHPQWGLQYAGRVDRQVKINGFRVELQEVEHSLRSVAQTELVAVLPWPRSADGLYTGVAGFVVQPALPAEQIRERLAALLPAYMQPSLIRSIERMPVNANGKVDYGQLRQWLEGEQR